MSTTHSLPSSSSSEPKKKFGTNLNKLTKPPPPPPSSLNASSLRGSASQSSSRNGLLVLSTKRSNSLPVSGVGSSLLASKSKLVSSTVAPRPLNTPSLRSESLSSCDVLLTSSTASGGGGGGGVAGWGVTNCDGVTQGSNAGNTQLSAWGAVDKSSQHQSAAAGAPSTNSTNVPVLAPKGGVSSGYYDRKKGASDEYSKTTGFEPTKTKSTPFSQGQSQNAPPNGRVSTVKTGGSSLLGMQQTQSGPVSQSSTHQSSFTQKSIPPRAKAFLHSKSLGSSHDFDDDSAKGSNGYGRFDRNSSEAYTPRAKDETSSENMSQPYRPSQNNSTDLPSQSGETNEPNSSRQLKSSSIGNEGDMKGEITRSSVHKWNDTSKTASHVQQTQMKETVGRKSENDDITLNNSNERQDSAVVCGVDEAPVIESLRKDDKPVDEQVQFMSRLARERAEIRRAEEEAQENERKERAARRLKELENRMVSKSAVPKDIIITDMPTKFDAPSQRGTVKDSKAQKVPGSSTGVANQHNSEVVLEVLGRSKKKADSKKGNAGGTTAAPTEQTAGSNLGAKTTIDPTKTFSSLVGGNKAPRDHNDNERKSSKIVDENLQKQQSLQNQPPSFVTATYINAPFQYKDHNLASGTRDGSDDQPPISFIQLSSYGDRDRGERNSSSGPRMLFDPKSGSMVAAPSTEKRGYHNYGDDNVGGKGRKDRGKQKSRSVRDRELPPHIAKRAEHDGGEPDEYGRRSRKSSESSLGEDGRDSKGRRQQRKEEVLMNRKERKRAEKDERQFIVSDVPNASLNGPSLPDGPHNASSKRYGNRNFMQKQQATSDKPKIPRTCGVLYQMDEHGNYFCADGCDADQGYGAHSVPGGRLRNPAAHTKYLEQMRQQQFSDKISTNKSYPLVGGTSEDLPLQHTATLSSNGPVPNFNQGQTTKRLRKRFDSQQKKDLRHQSKRAVSSPNYELNSDNLQKTSFEATKLSFQGDPQQQQRGTSQLDFNYALPSHLQVKPKEKISILTGDPESPELQATANPWAPSEAALAAAAAARAAADSSRVADVDAQQEDDFDHVSSNIINVINDTESEDDDEELNSSPSFEGLGFDPTENMDTFIMSPSLRSEPADDGIDLKALTLNPSGTTSGSINPFAPLGSPSRFLDSSTWATGGTLNTSPGATAGLSSVTMGSLNWNLLGPNRGDSTSVLQHTSAAPQTATGTAASFLSLSTLSVNHDGVTWGSGGFSGGLGDIRGPSLNGMQSNGSGEKSE